MNIKLIREALNEATEYILHYVAKDCEITEEVLEKLSIAFDETFNMENVKKL